MPYPVLPPEPPAIINSLPPEEHKSSVTVAATVLEPAFHASENVSEAAQSVVVGTLSAPTPPETFAPENSAADEPSDELALPAVLAAEPEIAAPQALPPAAESHAESAAALGSPQVVEIGDTSVAASETNSFAEPVQSANHRHSDVHINATAPALPPRYTNSVAAKQPTAIATFIPSLTASSSPRSTARSGSAAIAPTRPLKAPVSSSAPSTVATVPPAPSGWSIVATPPASNSKPSSAPKLPSLSPAKPTPPPVTPAEQPPVQPVRERPTPQPALETAPEVTPATAPSTPATPPARPQPTVSPSNTPTSDTPTLVIPESTPPAVPPQSVPVVTPPSPGTQPSADPATSGVIELSADRQEYDEQRRVFTAEGNVLMRFRGAVLDTERLQVNIPNRLAVAEGDVALTRGEQVLRGDRFEYNFVQNTGTIAGARGEIFLPSASTDFAPTLPTDVSAGVTYDRPLSDRVTAAQPTQNVFSPGGINVGTGVGQDAPTAVQGGSVRRLRFEAGQIAFNPRGWQAQNVRITNDPFSPPELELRADEATLTNLSPLRDEVRAKRPRLVFDQRFSLPLLRSRVILDRRERDPALLQFGYDEEDRGGLFVQSTFEPISSEKIRFSVTPQFFIQKALTDSNGAIFDPSVYGLKTKLTANLSPRTTLTSSVTLNSLDPSDFDEEARANVRLRQLQVAGNHTLALDYSYRDRLFNGSLGYQDVQSSLGAFLISPVVPLGNTGISLSYQAGAQFVTADSDRLDLLDANRSNNRLSLGRFEASAALNKGFSLWQGKALPPTATEGLRYTPAPVVPYLQLFTGVRGVANGYTSGDSQTTLTGTIGLQGQVGHFSRRFFDYTGFNLSYSQSAIGGQSPFLFDRVVDDKVVSAGILQQIYGPFRLGFQTAINVDTGNEISTDYILEYSRRTYGVTARYNPVLSIGSIGLRISDFNWSGGTEPFAGTGIRPVEGGVVRPTND
ncbi:DUF3769 domain-containing protein [Trichocoleus sp. FACHB-591]|uniref:DUF3769 domain-containing protein n=1 Tax=Trichocoleus sp. FACHB-591 TaxID=2692872 RepID=UPI0016884530|nr:DUF3769 domain-containing protein [Trichocoleus sp. FACHB-591]MBD2098145.1 DUF3769 domain-containing protein [Trichocoleus sp. FACHB-591]